MSSLLLWTTLFLLAIGVGILLALLAFVAAWSFKCVRSFLRDPESLE